MPLAPGGRATRKVYVYIMSSIGSGEAKKGKKEKRACWRKRWTRKRRKRRKKKVR